MMRFGLCCLFKKEDIKFRTTTVKRLFPLEKSTQLKQISDICLNNAKSLYNALVFLQHKKIRAFRINSRFFPLYTHPKCKYKIEGLVDSREILNFLFLVKKYAKNNDVRLSFHPDQFILLSSSDPEILESSIAELEYHAMVANLVGAEVINIHIGGAYGNKIETLNRIEKVFNSKLSKNVKKLLTIENDDKVYTPKEVYELCQRLSVRMVYDVHHHRCNPDGLSIEDATKLCISTWANRGEPYLHISSPKNGWGAKYYRSHADYINLEDFPKFWISLKESITIDVEAKEKELAVAKLMHDLESLNK